MSKFIELSDFDGNIFFVNINVIKYIRPDADTKGCQLMTEAETLMRESYEEIKERIKNA